MRNHELNIAKDDVFYCVIRRNTACVCNAQKAILFYHRAVPCCSPGILTWLMSTAIACVLQLAQQGTTHAKACRDLNVFII